MASSGSSTSAYQFGATSGYRSEGDAGLTLVGCRFYDAQVGRFITRDTHLDQAPYAYCDGDPVNATDPSGNNPLGNFLGAVSWSLIGLGKGWASNPDNWIPGGGAYTGPLPAGPQPKLPMPTSGPIPLPGPPAGPIITVPWPPIPGLPPPGPVGVGLGGWGVGFMFLGAIANAL